MNEDARTRRRPLPWRARTAVLLLGVTGLLPAASLIVQLVLGGWPRGSGDALEAFDRRLASLRDAVCGQTTVGYLPPDDKREEPARAAHFYMTRWALAPVVVVDELAKPLVVADGVSDPRRLPQGFEIARDFGGGLLLLRPRSP